MQVSNTQTIAIDKLVWFITLELIGRDAQSMKANSKLRIMQSQQANCEICAARHFWQTTRRACACSAGYH